VAEHLLCSDCATVASFPGQREGESHHLLMCLIVVEFHLHRRPSIYVCTCSSSPQAFIAGPPLEIWDHIRSWIFHFANNIDLWLDFGESNGLISLVKQSSFICLVRISILGDSLIKRWCKKVASVLSVHCHSLP